MRFDWRWIALIVFIALLANAHRLPELFIVVLLGAGGGYLLVMGWRTWTRVGGAPTRRHVTYWRGQRYEIGPTHRGPALPRRADIGPALIYFLFGGILVLSALALGLRVVGL